MFAMTKEKTIPAYACVRDIIHRYDAFLLDLWGVIHDGATAYPEVHETLGSIREAGKKVIFLSNAPRRAAKAVEGLERLKIEKHLYDHVVTSGEVAYERLKARDMRAFTLKGNRYTYIGPERDAGLLDGLDYVRVEHAKDADFVLVTGYDEDSSPIDEKKPQLEEAIRYQLPLICANPDWVIVRISGVRAYCAGVIAKQYEDMGGVVQYFGKPYPGVYRKSLALLEGVPLSRIAAIGDSLTTDIKGANGMGIDSYLIAGGILGEALNIQHGELPNPKALLRVCEGEGVIPSGVLPALVWEAK